MEFYASCPEGFESALADELKRLGLSHVRRLKGRATFEGELEEGYRACLWSRLASRVFVVLGRFEAQDADELYDSVYDIAWETIIRPGATIAITARGVTEQLRNTRFSALRAKDALCDRLAETTGRRADVDAADPDVHLLLSLRQRRASISLDLSGDPLFKRLPPAATRAGEGAHVLRPDYAALVLAQVGWTALCERELTADDYENEALPTLIDASCAGGGLLLEAVNILTDCAPGAARERWGFEGWQLHDAALWEQLGLSGGLLLLRQDLLKLDLYGTIRAAVSTFDTFNHIPDLDTAIANAGFFMEKGGVFLFDMNTPYKHQNVLGENEFTFEEEDASCVWRNHYNAADRKVEITVDIDYHETGEHFHEEFCEYTYDLDTIRAALEKHGFALESVCDGETFGPLTEDSQRYFFCAVKQYTQLEG